MTDMTIPWWVLMCIGAALMIAEIFILAFVLLWFGIGALLVAGLSWLVPMDLGLQLLLTGLIGGVLMYLFRARCVAMNNATAEQMHTFSATRGRLAVNADGSLRVTANGTIWQVANPEAIPGESRVDGAYVEVTGFQNNQAVVRL